MIMNKDINGPISFYEKRIDDLKHKLKYVLHYDNGDDLHKYITKHNVGMPNRTESEILADDIILEIRKSHKVLIMLYRDYLKQLN